MKSSTKRITYCAVLAAIALILMYLVRFPLFLDFLEYDMGDVPIFIGTVMFGPYVGLMLTGVVCLLQGLFASSQSGIIGVVMHFLATGSFVFILGTMSRQMKKKNLYIPFMSGALTMVLVMIPLNFILSSAFLLKSDFFSGICSYTRSLGKAYIAFPNGIKAIVVMAIAIAVGAAIFWLVTRELKNKSEKGNKHIGIKSIMCGMIAGLVYAALVVLPLNLLLGDIHFSGEMAMIHGVLWKAFVPFNVIKAFGNGAIAYIIYLPLSKYVHVGGPVVK